MTGGPWKALPSPQPAPKVPDARSEAPREPHAFRFRALFVRPPSESSDPRGLACRVRMTEGPRKEPPAPQPVRQFFRVLIEALRQSPLWPSRAHSARPPTPPIDRNVPRLAVAAPRAPRKLDQSPLSPRRSQTRALHAHEPMRPIARGAAHWRPQARARARRTFASLQRAFATRLPRVRPF